MTPYKVLRIHLVRKVEQHATQDIILSDEEYAQLKNNKINSSQLVKQHLGDNLGYDSIGWIETSAEEANIEFEIGTWSADSVLR